MKRRLMRWNGVLIRNPSPPIASIACAIPIDTGPMLAIAEK